MKYVYLLSVVLVSSVHLFGQSSDQNYKKTVTYLQGSSTIISNPQAHQANISIQYLDGLGRPFQEILNQFSPNRNDLVMPLEYDGLGRLLKEYLPYESSQSNGNYVSNWKASHSSFYSALKGDAQGYSTKVYEASPLNRLIKQGSPGAAWQPNQDLSVKMDKVVYYNYELNTASDQVLNWDIEFTSDGFISIGYYLPVQLTKTITTDEEGHAVIEFVDKLGQTILKRVQAVESPNMTTYTPGEWADTYYIYDNFGDLRYVLPPEAIKAIGSPSTFPYAPSPTLLDNWAFQYQYDGRRRMIEKKVPGAEPVKMIYDNRDRLVLTQ
ncbi:MAG: DUF6443 domain-containing protein, partial [Bacteroidota bacterium]